MTEQMTDRLILAYRTAMVAAHGGAKVEVHLGSDAIEHLLAAAVEAPKSTAATCWGFPLVQVEQAEHISVHSVEVIL